MQKLRCLPILIKNLPTSDNILSFSLDAEVTNLVQMKLEKFVYLAFLTCEAFFDKGRSHYAAEVHPVRNPVVSRADAERLISNGVQGCNGSFVLHNYDSSIHYHQSNLTAYFALLRERR